MITDEFKKAYDNLNQEQKEAVDTIEGPVMVIAGPGTGKTQILTLRIANILLQSQINPENILALTFSEAASLEMRNRLIRIIGTSAFRVDISTFHSFANSIIKNYPDEFPMLLSSENITEVEQIDLFERLIESLDLKILRPFGEPLYYLKDILSTINDLKKEGVSPQKLEVGIQKQKEYFSSIADLYHQKGPHAGIMKGKYQDLQRDIDKSEELLKLYSSYQEQLKEQKKYDFNDMLSEVVKALEENKSLLLRVQEKYQYILVDEHQDTNAAQNRLIELVASFYEVPNLFVVGDEKQAIYRFQGASLENFLYFKNQYPQAKLINLEKNYRSHQNLLDATFSLIEKNISANILPQKKLLSTKELRAEKIQVAELSDYHLEYEYIASDIIQKISHGFEAANIAVLARRNSDLLPLADSLNRYGVKFIIQSEQDILKDIYIQKLLILLESIGNPFDAVLFFKAIHIDFLNISPFDIYKLLNYSKKHNFDFFVLIDDINASLIKELKLESADILTNFYQKYKEWVKMDGNIPFDDLFIQVIKESGLREFFLKSSDRYETLTKMIGLFDEIKLQLSKDPQFTLADFLKYLQIVKKHHISLKAKSGNSFDEGVKLQTIHRSKGLEFDWVYIINCFDGHWGGGRKRGVKIKIPWSYLGQQIKAEVDFEEIEDERRLFYVGLTRAKIGITLTYSKKGIEGKEQLPSQFLQEIDECFIERIDTSGFEKSLDRTIFFEEAKNKKIDSKNKKYLQELFYEKGLSATGLDNFLKCPWRYFFKNLVSLPDIKNKNLIFGTAVHYALESFIKTKVYKEIGEGFLIEKFKEYLNQEAVTKNDLAELIQKGEKALKLFYAHAIVSWPQNIQSEMVIKGVKLDEKVILNGRLDMIEVLSNDGSVRVHDFKTGKPKSRSAIDGSKGTNENNYLRQLTFYKILLDKHKNSLFQMKEGVIDFVEPDDKGRLHSEVFVIGEQQTKELEVLIKSVAKQILELSFWDQRCEDADCEYCKLRESFS